MLGVLLAESKNKFPEDFDHNENIYVNLFILAGLLYLPAMDPHQSPREDWFIDQYAAPFSVNIIYLLFSRNPPVKFIS